MIASKSDVFLERFLDFVTIFIPLQDFDFAPFCQAFCLPRQGRDWRRWTVRFRGAGKVCFRGSNRPGNGVADNFRVEGFFSFRKLVVTPVRGCPHARKADDEEAAHRGRKKT